MASWFLLSCPYANRVGSGWSGSGSSEETCSVPLFSSDTWLWAFGCHLLSSYCKMSAEESLFFIMRRKRQQREKWGFWKCHHATSVSLPVVASRHAVAQPGWCHLGDTVLHANSAYKEHELQGEWHNSHGFCRIMDQISSAVPIPCLLYALFLFNCYDCTWVYMCLYVYMYL